MRTVILLLLTVLWSHSAFAEPEATIRPYEFETWSGEKLDAEWGEFVVPEDRSDPDSRELTLKFVRFRSTADRPGAPIVYLAGGPGGSGIGSAKGSRLPLFLALREFGDVIAFDQRGTGESGFEEMDCDDLFMVPLDQPLDRAVAAAIVAEKTKDCMDRKREAGIDVSAYNTRESAADLNDLRLALGADKLVLWGISYGTHLALATMKYHPDAVDKAILAGLEGLHHSYKLPSDQQALMEEIARRSDADPTVNAMVPDLLGAVERSLARLEAEPVTVEVVEPRMGATMRITVGKFDLQLALANMLRGPEQFAAMPDAVARVDQGDYLELALAMAQRRMGEGVHSMSAAMDCASGASREWLDRIAREAEDTLLGDAINFPFPDLCAPLGIEDLGDGFRSPVVSDIPTLLISGTLDGRTPVSNGDEVAEHLSRSQHLVIDGAGHSDPLFLSSPQILESMQQFLRGESIASTRIELPPVEFVAPRSAVELAEEVLDTFQGEYRISGDDTRVVRRAGNILYTRRGRGGMLPIRPTSETEFYYVGTATHLTFERDDNGEVIGMVVYHDGVGDGERAEKID